MSSKRRLRKKECDRKVRHADREAALTDCRRTGQGRAEGLGVYRCKHCQAWHVGHGKGSRYLITQHLATAVLYHD